MKIQIRRDMFETSSSSASTIAVAANGSKKRQVKLDKPFRLVWGEYDVECDGRPHCYLTDWRAKMAYFAEDTKEWHDMFKHYTGQDFEMYYLWEDAYRYDKNESNKIANYRKRREAIKDYVVTVNNTYCSFDGYICGTALKEYYNDGDLYALPKDMDGAFYGLEKYFDDYGYRGYGEYTHYGELRDILNENGDCFSGQRLMEEIIFNDSIGINMGGDAYCYDYSAAVCGKTVPGDEKIPPEDKKFAKSYLPILKTEKNGNELLVIAQDGSKIRIINGDKPEPEYPDTIDMKITDCCWNNCSFCYEGSSPEGLHGRTDYAFLKTIPRFTEIAVGGGNPLAHPKLKEIAGLTDIVNITVHENDFMAECYACQEYPSWRTEDSDSALNCFNAIGVSCTDFETTETLFKDVIFDYRDCGFDEYNDENEYSAPSWFGKAFPEPMYLYDYTADNTFHFVNGIVTKEMLEFLYGKNLKILILGYKEKGRGVGHLAKQGEEVRKNQKWLYEHIGEVMTKFKVVGFDALAIRQLEIKRFFTDEEWELYYMGDDGEHSMYIDLVKGEFGISSTDDRRWPVTSDIREMFRKVREEGGF